MKKEIHLTRKDFRVDTFRSGGKGGQHQNKVESGVRITHIETGISAESRIFDSQHRNKKNAFHILAKKILAYYYVENNERFEAGKTVIRTYNQKEDYIIDKQTKAKYSFKKTFGKNDISEIINDRRNNLIGL